MHARMAENTSKISLKVIKKLRDLKNASKLRKVTKKGGKSRNATRWSSTHDMLKREVELEPFYEDCNFTRDVL